MNIFDLNTEFDDWKSVLEAKKAYENASNTVLSTRGSNPMKGDNETALKFRYIRKVYHCKAGKERETKSKGLRNSSTYKANCPAMVVVVFNGKKLVVTQSNLHHENHLTDEQTFQHYPENMRLTTEQEERVAKLLALGANKTFIKMDLMKETGKPIMKKSLHNLQTKNENKTRNTPANNLQELYDALSAIPGAKVRFITNDQNELVGIFFQDERMSQMYDKYPEVILFDASYKLNNVNFALFIQLCIDSNGETEIVSLYICRGESREAIGAMLTVFKELNTNWYQTKVFIGDKDFADRSIYIELFPNAVLQICLFHVFQAFNREVTTSKRNITSEQRIQALEILQRLAYSDSRHCYNVIYEELCDLKLEKVTKYFNENWDTIKEEWTLFGRNQYANFMNSTNNRSERLNRTIKQLCQRNSNLSVFFKNLSTTVACLASEKDIKVIRLRMKTERKRFDDPALEAYHKFLTPCIYKKVESQYKLADTLNIELIETESEIFRTQSGYIVTTETCSCTVYKTMNIPCRHIFKLLKTQEMNLFAPTICLFRWTKQCYYQAHPALNVNGAVQQLQPISVQTIKQPDEINRYKKAAAVTKEINNFAATMTSAQHALLMEKLTEIRNYSVDPDNEPTDAAEDPNRDQNRVTDNGKRNRSEETVATSASGMETGTASATSSRRVETGTAGAASPSGTAAVISNDAAEFSNQFMVGSSRNDVAVMKLPPKINSLGRPTGKVNTAIGLKLKRKAANHTDEIPSKKRFLDLSTSNQSLNIVHWLTNKTVKNILSKKTERHEIIEDTLIFDRLRNDGIDFSLAKKHFEHKAYKYMCEEIEKLGGEPWHCGKCRRNLSGEQIMCSSCLDWYHGKCAGKVSRNVDFFCDDCKDTCKLIVL